MPFKKRFLLFFAATVVGSNLLCGTSQAQSRVSVKFLGTIIGDSASTIRLSHPLGMSIDLEDNIYLADTGNHRVLKCDVRGKLLREVGGFGFGPQQSDRPADVWAANGLDVFVADYNNRRVQRYDKDLNFISSYASDENLEASLQFGYPAALALSAQGELFLADHEYNRMLRFDSFGVPKASFGDFNWGEGGLERPAKIFISRRNEVWVSDSSRRTIHFYDMFGNFLRRIDFEKNAAPCGMAEWNHGIMAADCNRHAVIFFSAEGQVLGTFGGRGTGRHEFTNPAAIAKLHAANMKLEKNVARILVLDSGNQRVQLLEVRYLP